MKIRTLTVQNFRIHDKKSVEFSDNITYIYGDNGTGKTTLLEAVYMVLQGSSFKGSDREITSSSKSWYRVDATFDDKNRDTQVKYSDKKAIKIDGKESFRIPKNKRYPVVLFEPDILRMVSGSPSRRRDYLDKILSTIDDNYKTNLKRYERSLLQRNSLLKQRVNEDVLFAWNIALSEYGSYIVASRQKLTKYINDSINDYYGKIAKKDDKIEVLYTFDKEEDIANNLLKDLEKNTEKDFIMGTTTSGPHRHDLKIHFNDKLADEVASRGEIRTIVLALKFIEVDIIEQVLEKRPIILLDDVLGELDKTRQRQLMKTFDQHQIIITSTIKANINSKNIKHLNL